MPVVALTHDELRLIFDALDSHVRYALSDEGIGGDGEPFGPDEDGIQACIALDAKLASVTERPNGLGDVPTGDTKVSGTS